MEEKFLDFEKPIAEQINHIKDFSDAISSEGISEAEIQEIIPLKKEFEDDLQGIIEGVYSKLTPFQAVEVARHIDRPSTIDYIKLLCGNDFFELHGDRLYSDDKAIVGGIGRDRKSVV